MKSLELAVLQCASRSWPGSLTKRLRGSAPTALQLIGPEELLLGHKVALFCSARTPGEAILRAYDTVRRMRDEGVTTISGFHSPIEIECLKLLLRGNQPIIICPGRAIESMRIPGICRAAFQSGRILFVSPFTGRPKRVSKDSALRRNEVVAALADEAYVAHMESGGMTDHIVKKLIEWKVPIL